MCNQYCEQVTVPGGSHVPGEKLTINGVPSADNYDLCINSSVLGINKTAEIIRDFVVQKLHIELPQETISPTPEVF